MTPNPELRDVVRRAYQVLIGGTDRADDLVLDDDRVVAIGSDPEEWWEGHDQIVGVFRAQGEAMRGGWVEGSDPKAYAVGDVGWVTDRPTLVMPDGTRVPFRVTATALRSDGAWKVVQWHGSVGVPNEEAVGTTLPTSAEG